VALAETPAIRSYWPATRHPGPCLLFLAPLLLTYELGVLFLGGSDTTTLRNGADTWVRAGLSALYVTHPIAVPALVVGILVGWYLRYRDSTPAETPSVCLGMAVESVFAALALWGISRAFGPALGWLGVSVSVPPLLNAAAVGQVVTFIGAGVYEELIFRMILFGGTCVVLRSLGAPGWLAVASAAVGAALLFAAAHHIGPHGEPVDSYNFLFRTTAGLFFTGLYQVRGFGIAVGAHACYDVLVGIAM
jgi:membrane protease YdiL (CAAX protease family)